MEFWVKKFSVIDRLLSLGQETRRVEAEGDKTAKVNFMLNEIHDPIRHLQKVPGVIVEVKGDLDPFNEGKPKCRQSQMEKFMRQRFGQQVGSQLQLNFSRLQSDGFVLQINGENGGVEIPAFDVTQVVAVKSIHFLQ